MHDDWWIWSLLGLILCVAFIGGWMLRSAIEDRVQRNKDAEN